ncbi:MAG: hypothetical protein U0174_18345 [Polyangiaceae bacterium]
MFVATCALFALSCSKPEKPNEAAAGAAGTATAAKTIGTATSVRAIENDAGSGAAAGSSGGTNSMGDASVATAPALPQGVLAPILANTAMPFPVSPACNGYVLGDVNAEDTIRARVFSGWTGRCKAILESTRAALASEYPAFAHATIDVADDDPKSKEQRVAGAVIFSLAKDTAHGASAGRASAIYSVEWTHPVKGLGPFCPYKPEPRMSDGPEGKKVAAQSTYPVSLKRLYRVGYATLMLGDFPAESIQAIGLKLEAALDRCAAVARRGS